MEKIEVDLKGYRGFALRYGDSSKEASAVSFYCMMEKVPLVRFDNKVEVPDDLVPSGSVEWVTSLLGFYPKPDYYPEWVQDVLYRKVWEDDKWILGEKTFVKPADRYKRFTGFVTTGTYKKKKKPPYVYSEIVEFENEWRYYISNGKVLAAEWYWGDEVNTPDAPELEIEIPDGLYAAADFGTLPDGRLACIEVQHPFSCGWYGHLTYESYPYVQWLIDGWIYMRENS